MNRDFNCLEVFFGDKIREFLNELNRLKVIEVHLPVATDNWKSIISGHLVLLVTRQDQASRLVLVVPMTPHHPC